MSGEVEGKKHGKNKISSIQKSINDIFIVTWARNVAMNLTNKYVSGKEGTLPLTAATTCLILNRVADNNAIYKKISLSLYNLKNDDSK